MSDTRAPEAVVRHAVVAQVVACTVAVDAAPAADVVRVCGLGVRLP